MSYPEPRYRGEKCEISAVHAFRDESGEPASMLILFAPGAPREPYFEQVADMAGRSGEERAEFFLRHDTFWV